MALLTTCQASFQSMKDYEDVKDDVESLKENIHECYSEISKNSAYRQGNVSYEIRIGNNPKRLSGKHYTEQFRNPNGLHKDNK